MTWDPQFLDPVTNEDLHIVSFMSLAIMFETIPEKCCIVSSANKSFSADRGSGVAACAKIRKYVVHSNWKSGFSRGEPTLRS
jgi:hypothetical protein